MGIRKDRYKAMVPQVIMPLAEGHHHVMKTASLHPHHPKLKFTCPAR
jgi:hypothetical protein